MGQSSPLLLCRLQWEIVLHLKVPSIYVSHDVAKVGRLEIKMAVTAGPERGVNICELYQFDLV